MNRLDIKKLDPLLIPLVQKLYKKHYKSGKAKRDELIYVAYCQSDLCGVVRLRTIDECRLLTGMLVIPEYRKMGIAHLMMKHCINETLNSADYCFAYANLQPFYHQHGFEPVKIEHLPASLKPLFIRYCQSGKDLIPMRFSV